MIQSNELRENNYYLFTGKSEGLFDFEKELGRIGMAVFGHLYVEFKHQSNESLEIFTAIQIEPIPLTPELLEKCGAVKDKESEFGGYLLEIDEDEKIRLVQDEIGYHWPMNGYCKPDVYYLHQLQNLYFALTQTELSINL